MNIWIITSQFPPVPGGIATYVAHAADMFAQGGHHVTVIAPGTSASERLLPSGARLIEFDPQGIPCPAADLSAWPLLSYRFALFIEQLANRDGPPDVIESQEYGALPYFLLQRRLTMRTSCAHVPVVLHLHSPEYIIRRENHEPAYRLPGYWVGRMEQFCMLACDGILSPSTYLRDDIVRELPQLAEKITVIPYPYRALITSPSIPTPGDLVYVGRMEARKGILPLVETCARLWEADHAFSLTLIGLDTLYAPRSMMVSDILRQRYAKWIEQQQLVLAGALSHPELLERVTRAWAVLVPSTWDNYPNTCIEAMGLGKLVVASSSGGQAEMIGSNGQAGLLFEWSQHGSCEQALLRALRMESIEQQAIGASAKERIDAITDMRAICRARELHFDALLRQWQPQTIFPSLTAEAQGHPKRTGASEHEGLLSVVVPFFNLGSYIEQTIESIARSDHRPLEIIVVNDGTTEAESLKALDRIRERWPHLVQVITTPNSGLASTRNTGADQARGEYLTFVDGDDLVGPTFFTKGIDVIQRYQNVSFAYSWVQFFEESRDCWPAWNTEFPYLLGHNLLTAFVIMRRSDFLTYGRNDPTLAFYLEDHESLIRMVASGCVGVAIPDPLVHYRIRRGSMTRLAGDDRQLLMMERIIALHPQLYQHYGPQLFALQHANGAALRWNHPAADIVDYRARYIDLLGAHERLLRYLAPLRPLVQWFRQPHVRSLLRRIRH